MRTYLIINVHPHYTESERDARTVYARRCPRLWFHSEHVRSVLEDLYPGRRVYSQMEQAAPGSLIYSAYLSPSRDGVGRVHYNFELWAIGPATPPDAGGTEETAP